MQRYADLFKENHITGKRLLLLTDDDMRDMGVRSKGHAMHLKVNSCNAAPLNTQIIFWTIVKLLPVVFNYDDVVFSSAGG